LSFLLHNLLRFGQVLHTAGLDVPAGRMIDVASALEHVDIGRRSDFYFTLRALLVQRPQDFSLFDEAFRVFWRTRSGSWSPHDLRAMGERRRIDATPGEPPMDAAGEGGSPSLAAGDTVQRTAALSYSDREVFSTRDFGEFTDAELQQARLAIADIQWDIGFRRTRRWKPAAAGDVDLRRVASQYARSGELLSLPARRRVMRRRPLVLICDVSGSMERYTRLLLQFVHGLSHRLGRVETFLFATRLTRVTRELAGRDPEGSMRRLPRHVTDWGGGTRIGETLRTFNVHWARRVMARGPVVLMISDGWDRGEPDVLRAEIARLQRSCHRLIWLNPLLGSPGYQPLTRGMQAALPFVDDFLPVHNLASLEALAEHLNRLPPRRSRSAARRLS
jgi:uncharacterized protein